MPAKAWSAESRAAARSPTGATVDQLAGEDRRQHVGGCRQHHRGGNARSKPGLPSPVCEGESEDGAEGVRPPNKAKASHGLIPVRSESSATGSQW